MDSIVDLGLPTSQLNRHSTMANGTLWSSPEQEIKVEFTFSFNLVITIGFQFSHYLLKIN